MNQQLKLFDKLHLYEASDVEYKAARGGLPKDLWATYSAFANTVGGTIWLGISQREKGLDVHGVRNAEELVGDFWNTVNNRSKVNRNILANDHVEIVPVPGGETKLVRIDVPRATRHQRPIFLGPDPFRGTYRRGYEGDYVCDEEAVRRMFADQSDVPADSRILEGFGLEDLDPESLRQFRQRIASRRPDHPWLAEDDRGLLAKVGGWRTDRATGQSGLTVAGLLMFGLSEAISAPESIPSFHLDYRERLAEDPSIRWSDRITLDGTWSGNLFQFYYRVIAKLAAGPGIKAPFQVDSGGTRQAASDVHEALQEALVNALVHADYSGQGGVVIDRYPDRYEFSNPGTLLLSLEQIARGGISECRNKSLQQMFQILGLGDKAGSGIDKIRASWVSQAWQSPSLQERNRPDRVFLILPVVSTVPESVLTELRRRFGPSLGVLQADEVQALSVAAAECWVSNQRLQGILTLHRRDITALLQSMVQRDLLVPDGSGRGTRYRLGGDLPPGDLESGGARSPPVPDIPPDKAVSPPDKAVSPPDSGQTHPGIGPAATLSPSQDPVLIDIASVVSNRTRAEPQQVRTTILRLCDQRFLTLRQLAQLLNRTAETLRDQYISPLVKKGLLELRHPERPSHRDQAYKATHAADRTER